MMVMIPPIIFICEHFIIYNLSVFENNPLSNKLLPRDIRFILRDKDIGVYWLFANGAAVIVKLHGFTF